MMNRPSNAADGISGSRYRNIFVLDSRAWFVSCRERYDPSRDLVLTYDFALKREIEAMGGACAYVDHLLSAERMHRNNFLAYEFMRRWHYDAEGRDLFEHRGVAFGFSFRIYFWSEYLFYVRARLCLERLRELTFDAIFAGTRLGTVESILDEMGIGYSKIAPDGGANSPSYYFPIHAWMSENIGRRGFKARITPILTATVGTVVAWFDRMRPRSKLAPAVFVQLYHPTAEILRRLRKEGKVRVVGVALAKSFLRTLRNSRYIPLRGEASALKPAAEAMLEQYRSYRCAKLVLDNGVDASKGAYATIDGQIAGRLPQAMRDLESIVDYLDKNPIDLQVMISNVGGLNGLVDSACKARGVPSFMIINGWLSGDFLDEGKYATFINAYSPSVKEHYFRAIDNVVCLGDPRMDSYPAVALPRPVDRKSFTVTIGASGYNNIDLNSYVAVEYDFMFDVLSALEVVRTQGADIKVVIKVRPNGYAALYREFTEEYFPGVVHEIVDGVPMKEVLEKSDFYISIYSQTIFEASCLGIPAVYYKKDTEILHPPFDGNSELTVATCVKELVDAVADFRDGRSRFRRFLKRSVMEKYIGPLDGSNAERNIRYIYELLERQSIEPCQAG
jgi:hypothetical protein